MTGGQAKFCTACGTALAPGARFCTGCGAQAPATGVSAEVQAAAPASPPQPPPSAATPAEAPAPAMSVPYTGGEHVFSVIPNAMLQAGFMGVKTKPYILVLTERRIIGVFITNQRMKQLVLDARDMAKSEGKGFFGQWGSQLGAYSALAESYLTMPPEQALAEATENFAIERSTITKTKLKTGTGDYESGASGNEYLIIKTPDKKYKFMLGAGRNQAKKALLEAELI